MEPSEDFRRYAMTLALFEAQRIYGASKDIFVQGLWAAAIFDWYCQSGETVRMLDGLGVPLADARQYEVVIAEAFAHFQQAGNVP